MILEVQKINNQFVILNPPIKNSDHYFIDVDEKKVFENDTALPQLKNLATKYPDNVFLSTQLKYYVSYNNEKNTSDDDLLYDALKDKYGL